MRIEKTELPDGVLKVELVGALDIPGVSEIELPFSIIAGEYDKVVVDFTNVTFLSSIGIRILVKIARTLAVRKGRFVIYNPATDARKVLRSTGVDTIITVVSDESSAIAECTTCA